MKEEKQLPPSETDSSHITKHQSTMMTLVNLTEQNWSVLGMDCKDWDSSRAEGGRGQGGQDRTLAAADFMGGLFLRRRLNSAPMALGPPRPPRKGAFS